MWEDEVGAMQVREGLAMQREDPLQGDLPCFKGAGKQVVGSRRHGAAGAIVPQQARKNWEKRKLPLAGCFPPSNKVSRKMTQLYTEEQ